MGVLASPPTQLKNNDRAEYWRRRREWWRAEAKRQGVDWDGIHETINAVAAFLADVKRRRAA